MSCCSYRCISCSSKFFSHFYFLFWKNSCCDLHLPAAALMFAVSGLCSHWGHWQVCGLFSAEHFSLPTPPQLLQNSCPLWKQNHLHLQLKPVPPCAGVQNKPLGCTGSRWPNKGACRVGAAHSSQHFSSHPLCHCSSTCWQKWSLLVKLLFWEKRLTY